jgi:hypothetical protein
MTMLMTLQPRQSASLQPQATVSVRCLRGTLWITGQDDGDDHVLLAGDSAELAARRHYLSSVRRNNAVSFEVRTTQASAGWLLRCWQRLRQLV